MGNSVGGHPAPPPPHNPEIYRFYFPQAAGSVVFPVNGCRGGVLTCINLRINLMYCHIQDNKGIMEYGNIPHTCCPACNMFVSWTETNNNHTTTALCAQVADRNPKQLKEEEARVGSAAAFQAYVQPLETVMSFNYLGHLLTTTDNYW